MNIINVTPMIPGSEQSITDDLKHMYQTHAVNSAAFIFTLVPEGNPVISKAARLVELYRKNLELLQDCDIPVGILLQATMGHGWTPSEQAGFQRFTFADGREPYIFCPLDQEFLKYVHESVALLAKEKHDFFMLDDDTRMICGRNGCFCPKHIAAFNERTGLNFTRETLVQALKDEPEKWAAKWDELQKDSVAGLAKTVRHAIDTASPQTPVIFCECAGDVHHAPAMVEALRAPGQTPMLRINNALYLNDSLWGIPGWMNRTMWQICALPENYMLFAETDSCPQNRYATSGAIMHLQYAWSLLAGCKGAKLWITETSIALNEKTGRRYRRDLADYAGFYREIEAMKPEWQGFIEFMPETPEKAILPKELYNWFPAPRPLWSADVFAYLGIPFSFEPYHTGEKRTVLLTGATLYRYSDAELHELLKGRVLIDGSAAVKLTERGFSGLIGLKATSWDLAFPSCEIALDGTEMTSGDWMVHLKELASSAEVRSTLYHRGFAFSAEKEALAPGMVRYHNAEGGDVTVYASNVLAFGWDAVRMMRESRKQWLVRELNVGMFYDDTAPMYFVTFLDRGHLTAAAINLGLDREDGLTIGNMPPDVKNVLQLRKDGSWQSVLLEDSVIQTTLLPGEIAFFRFS